MKKLPFLIFALLLILSCKNNVETSHLDKGKSSKDTTAIRNPLPALPQDSLSALECKLINYGLVDLQSIDTSILVDIKYSTTDNFMQQDLYADFDKAYLQKDVAQKLAKAQQYLKKIHPEYSLLVYDAVRPRHIQQQMWDSLKMPFQEKIKFVSNPKNGSLHNFGAAVDITIAKQNGKALDMGTPFDYIGKLAYPSLENEHLKSGKLNQTQINNRKLLRKVMYHADFFNIQTEWWHFNSCYRSEARKRYRIVE